MFVSFTVILFYHWLCCWLVIAKLEKRRKVINRHSNAAHSDAFFLFISTVFLPFMPNLYQFIIDGIQSMVACQNQLLYQIQGENYAKSAKPATQIKVKNLVVVNNSSLILIISFTKWFNQIRNDLKLAHRHCCAACYKLNYLYISMSLAIVFFCLFAFNKYEYKVSTERGSLADFDQFTVGWCFNWNALLISQSAD